MTTLASAVSMGAGSFVKDMFQRSMLVPRRVIIRLQVTTAAGRRRCVALVPAARRGAA